MLVGSRRRERMHWDIWLIVKIMWYNGPENNGLKFNLPGNW
jgi:hypothetical protein